MNTLSYTAREQEIQDLLEKYQKFQKESKNPYIRYFFKTDSKTILIYTSNKVVIQSKEEVEPVFAFQNHAGSDESGVGDYFGPLTVCATVVFEKDLAFLKQFNIRDSKQLKDDQIREIAPKLMQSLVYSLLVLDNEKYNEEKRKYNLNEFKALMHNQAYIHLSKKILLPTLKVIDQFCEPEIYYHYLKNRETVELQFHTKAENKFLAVACASIIARYAFLCEMDKMNQKYDVIFPLGAGNKVDDFGIVFIEKYGKDELNSVAKVHFRNTEKIFNKKDNNS